MLAGPVSAGKMALVRKFKLAFRKKYLVVWVFDPSKEMGDQMIDLANRLQAHMGKKTSLALKNKDDALSYTKSTLLLGTFGCLLAFAPGCAFAQTAPNVPEAHGQNNNHLLMSGVHGRQDDQIVTVSHFTDAEALQFLAHRGGPQVLDRLAAKISYSPLSLSCQSDI
jgi:hypothetical protein